MSMVLQLAPIHYYSFAMNNISLPNNTLVKPHELEVARILASHGEIVKFIPVSNIKTPDIIYRGLKWEIKSPTGRIQQYPEQQKHGNSWSWFLLAQIELLTRASAFSCFRFFFAN